MSDSFDDFDDVGPSINPASGLPMAGHVDIAGNPYGFDWRESADTPGPRQRQDHAAQTVPQLVLQEASHSGREVRRTLEVPAWPGIATSFSASDVIGEACPRQRRPSEMDRLLRQIENQHRSMSPEWFLAGAAAALVLLLLLFAARTHAMPGSGFAFTRGGDAVATYTGQA